MNKRKKFNKPNEVHYCCNCGKVATQAHHIVPLANGGQDVITNIAWLCDCCHDKVHGLTRFDGTITHSELIKQGLAKAKENGKSIGRPSLTIKNIPLSFKREYKKLIQQQKRINITELAKKYNLTRVTIYKYIELLANA